MANDEKRKGWNCLVNKTAEGKTDREMPKDQYYSAEFSVNGLGTVYQFRLWETDSTPMCVLVREDSNLLPWLRVGDVYNVKYYAADSGYSPDFLSTEIRDITKDDEGRFKGHYMVGLEILEERQDCA
jgi:hypothetical protein